MISNSDQELKALVTRIEKMEDEKSQIALDITEIYKEAKSNGFDVKILRKVVALRKKSADDRQNEAALLDLYMQRLGMLADTPLGQWAIQTDMTPGSAQ
jgi:uncharacterized protein (UPF0335 family)